jgi:hypothetical protein
MELRLKDRLLVDRYIALQGDLSAAARASEITVRAAQIALKKTAVREYLDQRVGLLSEASTASANEVISVLVSHMRADIADVFPDEPIVRKAREAGVSHLIKRIKVREDKHGNRTIEIELHDSQKAANTLARIFGIVGEDDPQKARSALKLYMELQKCSAEVAIVALAPHIPAVLRVRDEFVAPSKQLPTIADTEAAIK